MKRIKSYKIFNFKRMNEDKEVDILNQIYNIDRNNRQIYTYLHTTDKKICEKVFDEGFQFYDIHKQTDEISNNISDFLFKLKMRERYGDCTLVIQTYQILSDGEDFTIKEPFPDDDGEMVYTLSPIHIKGYYNRIKGIFIDNPNFKLQ